MTGWECPKCGNCYAPSVKGCATCNNQPKAPVQPLIPQPLPTTPYPQPPITPPYPWQQPPKPSPFVKEYDPYDPGPTVLWCSSAGVH